MKEEDKVPYLSEVCDCGHAGRAHGPTSFEPKPYVDRTCMYCQCHTFVPHDSEAERTPQCASPWNDARSALEEELFSSMVRLNLAATGVRLVA